MMMHNAYVTSQICTRYTGNALEYSLSVYRFVIFNVKDCSIIIKTHIMDQHLMAGDHMVGSCL